MKINSPHVIFVLFVCGAFGDEGEVTKVSVMEGDSVTLNSNLTEINAYRRILWRFGSELIAQISGGEISYENGSDGSFRDRLQLDSKTGSLTITNMRMKHSSPYELEAVNRTSGEMTPKKFSISVYESPSAITAGEVEMKSVSVTPGESLTLQTAVTDPHADQLIVWRFGDKGKLIAKADLESKKNSYDDTVQKLFSDRLKLDQTGSLTIMNTRNTDSGLYIVKISSSKQTLHKKFIVTVRDSGWSSGAVAGIVVAALVAAVVAAVVVGFLYYRWKMGDVMKVIVKEGDSVTLNTGVTELQTDDEIQWWNGDNLIVQITGGKEQTYDVVDERFFGKLRLDEKTGSLIISNIKSIHSGLYKLKITRNRVITHKRFILTVNPDTELATVGESHTLSVPTGTDLQEDDLIMWKFGPQGSPIATFDPINKVIAYDSPDERFRDKLNLNEKTGSLTIRNIKPEHAGVYKLQLSNSKRTTNRKCRVTVTGRTQSNTPELLRAQSNTPELLRTQSAELVQPPEENKKMVTVSSKRPDRVLDDCKKENQSLRRVSVKKGKTACLKTGVENLQNENIMWKFGDKNSPIAEIKDGNNLIIHDDVLNGRFKGRLELDEKTGSLSIKNTNTDDSGKYTVWIKNIPNKSTYLIFIVSVSENGAGELVTVEMPLLSDEQQSSL